MTVAERSPVTRRERIMSSLCECMLERGFAATTLVDVARGAEMSPSHLLYYYKGKDEILHAYVDDVIARMWLVLAELESEPLPGRLTRVADYFFGPQRIDLVRNERMEKRHIAIMLEFFGVAVHNKAMHATKAAFDRGLKLWLQEQFAQTPRAPDASSQNAAETAHALLIGLLTAAFFDERLGFEKAHVLFHRSLYRMAGYPLPEEATT
jgi:AcrR family transcriptional regulator